MPGSARSQSLRSAGLVVLLGLLLAVSVLSGRYFRRNSQHERPSPPDVEQGKSVEQTEGREPLTRAELLFSQHCARCHGMDGGGEGAEQPALSIRPRDFGSSSWRFAATRNAIAEVIREGITGSAMPALGSVLTDDDIASIAGLVLEMRNARLSKDSIDAASDAQILSAGFKPVVPARVPNLRLLDEDRKPVILSDLARGPYIVHLWGTSCAHCLKAMPAFNRTCRLLRRADIPVISICVDAADPDEITPLMEASPDVAMYTDPTGLSMNRLSVTLLPRMYLVDQDGWIVGVRDDVLRVDEIDGLLGFRSPQVDDSRTEPRSPARSSTLIPAGGTDGTQ